MIKTVMCFKTIGIDISGATLFCIWMAGNSQWEKQFVKCIFYEISINILDMPWVTNMTNITNILTKR